MYQHFTQKIAPPTGKHPSKHKSKPGTPACTKSTYRTGLGLGDEIAAEDGGLDGTLLDGRGLLETVGVDATEKLLGELHAVEGLDGLVPVGVDVGIGKAAGRGIIAALSLLGRGAVRLLN